MIKKHIKKNIDEHLIRLTGEYLVAGMMSLKGWVASLTLKNIADYKDKWENLWI